MSGYFDKEGKPMELLEWAKKFEDMEYRRIGLFESKSVRVSTVWMGLNHNYGEGTPLIFETMVFDKEGDELDMERYATLEEAKKGHIKSVEKWENVI